MPPSSWNVSTEEFTNLKQKKKKTLTTGERKPEIMAKG
jgi:hypothetical protein